MSFNKTIIILILLFCSLVSFAFISYFTGSIKTEENFGCYYDALGSSLIQGKLDVPEKYIGGEAFVNDGKFYGYFGLFPAVMRIGLNGIFPGMYCKWSRTIMLVFYFLTLFISYVLYFRFNGRRKISVFGDSIYLLLIGLGSSLLFLTSKSYTYHESLLIAVSCSLLSYYFFSRFIASGKERNFLLSVVLAFFAVHTRVNVGLGNMFSLGSYAFISTLYLFNLPVWLGDKLEFFLSRDLKISRVVINISIVVILGLVTIVTLCGINYIKFGNYFSFAPLDKHVGFINDPPRLDKIMKYNGGSIFSLSNVLHNGRYYLGPGGLKFSSEFPYVFSQTYRSFIHRLNSIDKVENNVSLLYVNPFVYFAVVIGCVIVFINKKYGNLRLLVLGSIVTIFPTLCAVGVTQRYEHDFFPFIVMTSAIGFVYIYEKISDIFFLKLVLTFIVVVTIYINFAITLNYQKKIAGFTNPKNSTILAIFANDEKNLDMSVFHLDGQSVDVLFEHAPGDIKINLVKPMGSEFLTIGEVMSPDIYGSKKGNGVKFKLKVDSHNGFVYKKETILNPANVKSDMGVKELRIGPFPNKYTQYVFSLELITDPLGNNAFDWSGWSGFYWDHEISINRWLDKMMGIR